MTKVEAIYELLRDSHDKRASTASAKRSVKACKALGLNNTEIRGVMAWLDYCDSETGDPYGKSVQRVWP